MFARDPLRGEPSLDRRLAAWPSLIETTAASLPAAAEIDKYAKTKGLDSIEFMNDWRALETAANALMKRARGGEDVGLSAAGLKDGDQPLKMEGVQESGRPGKEASADVPKDVRDKASSGGNNKKAADATSSSKTSATAGSTTAGTTNGQGGGARKPHKPAPREAGEAAMAGEGPINL